MFADNYAFYFELFWYKILMYYTSYFMPLYEKYVLIVFTNFYASPHEKILILFFWEEHTVFTFTIVLLLLQPQRNMEGRWEYTLLVMEMLVVVLGDLEKYTLHRQNTITQYITTRNILELCLEAQQHMGARLAQR